MASDPPTTCAEFFRAAGAAGYSRDSARVALCVAVRRALGFRYDAAQRALEAGAISGDLLLGDLVSHVTDADPRYAVLFDVLADQRHRIISSAWAELTRTLPANCATPKPAP